MPTGDFPSTHFRTLVIGDLTKEEAHTYYLSRVDRVPEVFRDRFPRDFVSFEPVYYLTGGRMFFINQYVWETYSENMTAPTGLPNLILKAARVPMMIAVFFQRKHSAPFVLLARFWRKRWQSTWTGFIISGM